MTPTPVSARRCGLAEAADLGRTPVDVTAVLDHLVAQADTAAPTSVGFPGAVDLDHREVMARLGHRLWNNIGDPTDVGGTAHTRVLEQAVIAWLADTLAMPADDRWGYVTTGGTEGNLSALHTARRRLPTARIYYSTAAHYSIPKIIDMLGARGVAVEAGVDGEMDYAHLAVRVRRHRRWPAIVVATAGTTMTEAVDDTTRIHTILNEHQVPGRHVHVDAALSGIPLALDGRLRLDDDSGVGSIAVSGHKFLGVPTPCGVVLIRDSLRRQAAPVAYTATLDSTITGSRCGLAAALLWHAIATHGREGHRWRVSEARRLATYTVDQLTAAGWPAWRHPHAFTVVLATPPPAVRAKWLLATDADISHLICMPGVTQGQIDAFVTDLTDTTTPAGDPDPGDPHLPRPIPRPRRAPAPAAGIGTP
ncbi:histidine decarboxylase [Micromonospora rifamycinica]|uniref:L-histidine carboxy-lyase (Histamine-forming) n=1 Tax=Micromonospora rifamycinica TaxID=291594 RepID=A0A1C5KG60_9ACTN|nr:histidine decarboxylase [Micromonospora rifamycinica]SCG81587.1 L-histidine carboxy-lyase (histamine-forming) [Micromonospora rifamycinica]